MLSAIPSAKYEGNLVFCTQRDLRDEHFKDPLKPQQEYKASWNNLLQKKPHKHRDLDAGMKGLWTICLMDCQSLSRSPLTWSLNLELGDGSYPGSPMDIIVGNLSPPSIPLVGRGGTRFLPCTAGLPFLTGMFYPISIPANYIA